MILNLNNIENIVFENKEVRTLLPEYRNIFNQWIFATKFPHFRQTAKLAILDLLNNIGKEQIDILSNYFNEEIIVEKLNYHSINNVSSNILELEEKLNKNVDFDMGDIVLYRNKDRVEVTFWR